MNWYIGQEIVCIKTHSQGMVKRGQTFIIKGLSNGFCRCTAVLIDVGVISNNLRVECKYCNVIINKNSNVHWFAESYFSPLEYNQEAIDELLAVEEPVGK